jgi:succinate dehydrogenase / fumarate reductase cytochrome b subunit
MRKKQIVNKKRPVNLDLGSLKFPPMAIASILHRISGDCVICASDVIYSWEIVAISRFVSETKIMLTSPYYKLALWAFGAALIYHVIAGIKTSSNGYRIGRTSFKQEGSVPFLL